MDDALKTLGLGPGADYRQVELAYRNLIKQYHPDRPGGDAARAAEINRAYSDLRELAWLSTPARGDGLRPAPPPERKHRLGQALFAVSVLAAGSMLYFGTGQPADSPVVASSQPVDAPVADEQPAPSRKIAAQAAAPRVPRADSDGDRSPSGTAAPSTRLAASVPLPRPIARASTAAAAEVEKPAQLASATASGTARPKPPTAAPQTAGAEAAPKELPAWQRPLVEPWQRPLPTGERG